jgi:hypothetical protein
MRNVRNTFGFVVLLIAGILVTLPRGTAADASNVAQSTHFPRPIGLAPNVAFWKQVYTGHGVGDFILHDRDNLAVVYAVVHVTEKHNQARAADLARPEIERVRGKYRDILLRLAAGATPEELGADGQRVAESWGCPCEPDVLRRAAENIRMQQGLREKVDEGLRRAQGLLPKMMSILRQHDVPAELAALPMVESTFNPAAQSKAGAVGLWQFIRSTGKKYLTITRKRDDRRDPMRATEAAAHLLRNNYAALGSWPLAIVAYNHGHAGIEAASAAVGSRSIEDIVARYNGPRFGFASKNFYAEFLAALDVVHPLLGSYGKPVDIKTRQRALPQFAIPVPRPTVPEVAPPEPPVASQPVEVERPIEVPASPGDSPLTERPINAEEIAAVSEVPTPPAETLPDPGNAVPLAKEDPSSPDTTPSEVPPADSQETTSP